VLPLTIIEAMASRIHVAAVPVDGIPELIKDSVEGLFRPLDDHDRAERILISPMEDQRLATSLGTAAHQRLIGHLDANVVDTSLCAFSASSTKESALSAFAYGCLANDAGSRMEDTQDNPRRGTVRTRLRMPTVVSIWPDALHS